MIKNLFTKRDHRVFPGLSKEQAMQAAGWFWRSRNFGVNYTSPYSLIGSQFYTRLGLRQSINVWAAEEGKDVGVDVSFSAELTDEGAAVGLVGAVLVLPVTIAVGAVSYIEYENDAQRLMNEFWGYLQGFPRNPAPPSGPAAIPTWAKEKPAPSAPQPKMCPLCRSILDSESVFCKYCGTRL
jgi:hypothetical protein